MSRLPRSDGLPENTEYRDKGCSLHPACLRCPLTKCRYDQDIRTTRSEDRDAGIITARAQGKQIMEIAREFNTGKRTVFRVLAKARQS